MVHTSDISMSTRSIRKQSMIYALGFVNTKQREFFFASSFVLLLAYAWTMILWLWLWRSSCRRFEPSLNPDCRRPEGFIWREADVRGLWDLWEIHPAKEQKKSTQIFNNYGYMRLCQIQPSYAIHRHSNALSFSGMPQTLNIEVCRLEGHNTL